MRSKRSSDRAIVGRMNDRDLFALALGLTKPWFVSSVELDADQKKLELSIDFERGSAFPCPEVRSGWMQGVRHRTAALAASELLRVRDAPERSDAASSLRQVRNAAGDGTMGAAGQRLHAAV